MKKFKNGKTTFDADDIQNAMAAIAPGADPDMELTEGGAALLGVIATMSELPPKEVPPVTRNAMSSRYLPLAKEKP